MKSTESKLKKLRMPEDNEQEQDMSEEFEGQSEEDQEPDMEFPEDEEGSEAGATGLEDFSDEEIQAEMERRGLTAEMGEPDEMDEESDEDMDLDLDELE